MSGEMESIIINTEKVVEVIYQEKQRVDQSEANLELTKNYLDELNYETQQFEQETKFLEAELEVNCHFLSEFDNNNSSLRERAAVIYQTGKQVFEDISLLENEQPELEGLLVKCQQYTTKIEENYKKKLQTLQRNKIEAEQRNIEKANKKQVLLRENEELSCKINVISLECCKWDVSDQQKSISIDTLLAETERENELGKECEFKVKCLNEEKENILVDKKQYVDGAIDELKSDIHELNTQVTEEENKCIQYTNETKETEQHFEATHKEKQLVHEELHGLLEDVKKIEDKFQEANSNNIVEEKQKEIENLTEKITRQQNTLVKKEDECLQINKNVQNLEGQIESLESEITILSNSLKETETCKPDLNHELEILTTTIKNVLEETQEYQDKIKDFRNNFEEKRNKLSIEQACNVNKLSELQRKYKEIKKESEIKLMEQEADLMKVESLNNEIQINSNNNQKELEELNSNLNQMKATNMKLTDELKECDIQLENLNTDCKVLKAELEKNKNMVPIVLPKSFSLSKASHRIQKKRSLYDEMSDTSTEGEKMDIMENLKKKKLNELRKKSKKF